MSLKDGERPNLLERLLELETLDRIPRIGFLMRGVPDAESVAEHTFHLALLVWLLAGREPGVDRARAVEMALVHDLAEVRLGDLPRTAAGYFEDGAKHAAEHEVLAHFFAGIEPRVAELASEYEREESVEARFVHACDRVQLQLKARLYTRWGHPAVRELEPQRNAPASEFASLRELIAELVEDGAGI